MLDLNCYKKKKCYIGIWIGIYNQIKKRFDKGENEVCKSK